MRPVILVTTVAVLLTAASAIAADLEPQVQATLDAAYGELTTQAGQAYLAARQRLLDMDRSTVKAYLESRLQTTADTEHRLCLAAVLLRLQDAARLDGALDKAMAAAAIDRSHLKRSLHAVPDPPRPHEAGGLLVLYLGDDALPLATELLVKGLTASWDEWKRPAPIYTLAGLGRGIRSTGYSGHAEPTEIKDPRAAQVLLWVAENADDDNIGILAADCLRSFASPDLLASIQSARARTAADEKKRRRFERAERIVEGENRSYAVLATRPAGSVTTSLTFRFSRDANRTLTGPERSEFDRLRRIALDSQEPQDKRLRAVRFLALYVAHHDCIEPLRAILENDSEPESLRTGTVIALSQVPDKAVVPLLIEVLGNRALPPRVRSKAELQLTRLTAHGAFPGSSRPYTTAERCDAAVGWWQDWWKDNEATYVPNRILVVMSE
jgi:hypothetical protein